MTRKMKLLIGYDGSDCAEASLDDLQRAGLPADAEALVMTVAEIWLPPPPPSSYEILEEAREVQVPADLKRVYSRESVAVKEAAALAERARERISTNFPAWTVTSEASCGSPAWELVFKSDQWQPDLLVVGSHGRSVITRLVLGSVSQRVLAEARCSVRIARGRVEEPDYCARIIVGIDGSEASQLAAREVANRNWPAGSEIRLVVVDDPMTPTFVGRLIPPLAETIADSNREDRRWVEGVLQRCVGLFHRPEIKVTTEICQGEPKRELVKLAEEWQADSIFVGSIGFSNRLERFVLGSVSAAVVARAHCSVEVVRPARQEAAK